VINSGSIGGAGKGIALFAGGSVTNAAPGTIGGGVLISSATGTVVNSGTIANLPASGAQLDAVQLAAGGSITNAASASIVGDHVGVYILTGPGTVINFGTISEGSGTGFGVELAAGGTVTNAGTISGNTAIYFGGSGRNLLVMEPSAVLQGKVVGGVNASNALELASGSSAGTLTGLGTRYRNFEAVTVDSGAAWSLAGNAIPAGLTLTNDGILTMNGALVDGALINEGSISGPVTVGAGGIVTNAANGIITTGAAAEIYGWGGLGAVVNDGNIAGTGNYGVYLEAGGRITNAASALISSTNYAIRINQGAGNVVNDGAIAGGNHGMVLADGGSVTNAASGSITGKFSGINIFYGNATVINAGTIETLGGTTVGDGILLASDALESVNNSGTIAVVGDGVVINGDGLFSIANTGAIMGNRDDGVYAYALENAITNAASALIMGANLGVAIKGGDGTVVNNGSIAATGAYGRAGRGVALYWGGSVTNAAAAVITGGPNGIVIERAAGTVANFGTIASADQGVHLDAGGSVANAASASITGNTGVVLLSGGTVTNAGTITGSGGTAVGFGGTASNLLVVDPGAVFNGNVIGSTSASNTLELASGGGGGNDAIPPVIPRPSVQRPVTTTPTAPHTTRPVTTTPTRPGILRTATTMPSRPGVSRRAVAASGPGSVDGTLSGLGTSFTNFGSVTVDTGASWELTGANTIASGGTLVNDGTLTLSGATLTDAGTLVNNGVIVLDPSTLSVTTMSGSGSVAISSGSVLDVRSGLADNVTVSSGGTETVEAGGAASGTTVSNGGVQYDAGTASDTTVSRRTAPTRFMRLPISLCRPT